MNDRHSMTTARALRLLELEQAVPPRELREAYRDLVRVWHPDRFEGEPRLRLKASARLADINTAYRFLSSLAPASRPAQTRRPAAAPPARRAAAPARHRAADRRPWRAASQLGFLLMTLATFALGAAPRLDTVLNPAPAPPSAVSSSASDIPLPPRPTSRPVTSPPAAGAAAATVSLPAPAPVPARAPAPAQTAALASAPARPQRSPFSRDLDRVLARAAAR